MNQDIRKFLIDQCVQGDPINYKVIGDKLGLDLSLADQRQILSETLGEISAYEYENGRPLISSIAIYKQQNDHGPGFYSLCEELGIGKASDLRKNYYGFTQIEESRRFWQKPENYSAYYDQIDKSDIHTLEFFTSREIDFLNEWGGQVYDKDNNEHVAAKNFIMSSLGTKTQYWSNTLVKSIPGLDTFNWRMWSQKGWEETPNGNVRVARFKQYTWARIYREGDKGKDIFFTVGVDGHHKVLVYKLDYYFESGSILSVEQKEIIKKNIPKELRWKPIPTSKLEHLDWDALLKESGSFISEHLHVYDKLIQLAWGEKTPEEAFSNFLRQREMPRNGHETLPPMNPRFDGVEKDFVQESIEKKEIGDAGEELVKQYEIDWLRNIGHTDLANEVDIVLDGKGYDVLSFDADRNPKYIEVKTTVGGNLTPFYFTVNEKLFAERESDKYLIYRLFNFDEETNTADFFVIRNITGSVLMQPLSYKVYLKKSESSDDI